MAFSLQQTAPETVEEDADLAEALLRSSLPMFSSTEQQRANAYNGCDKAEEDNTAEDALKLVAAFIAKEEEKQRLNQLYKK